MSEARNPNIRVFEYRGQCTAKCYNQFFNPNICHVCKSVDKGNLIHCDGCYLISYCSEEHKTQHYTEHKIFCAIIALVLQIKPQEDTRRFNNWQQWIQSRKTLLESIQDNYGSRVMQPYEKQMILWPKSCYVCHQQSVLYTCQRCFSANYCNEHASVFPLKHDEAKCELLIRLLNIDIETISGKVSDISYNFLLSVNEKKNVAEMLEFCINYILPSRDHIDWFAKDYVQSDYLSGPLTVYFMLKKINSLGILRNNNVTIHIIATDSVNRDCLKAWEVLLHLVPEIKNLTIIMCGPELQKYHNVLSLCKVCKDRKKELTFISVPSLYHEFVRLNPHRNTPSIIVGFHVQLNERNTWAESIKVVQKEGCPLLLSFSCIKELQSNVIEIQRILKIEKDPYFTGKNYFAGLAPHRDLKTGNTYFRNEYLIFYDDLYQYDFNDGSSSSSLY